MSSIAIAATRSGDKTALITTPDGKELRLHSAFDPIKEATRSISDFTTKPNRIIIIAGCGLGYHVNLLKQKFPQNLIIVLESNPEMEKLCLEHFPQHLSDTISIHSTNETAGVLEKLDINSFKGTSLFIHRQSYNLNPDYYDQLISDISRYLTSRISDLLTRFEFEQRWVENILANCTLLPRCFPSSLLAGSFSGMPGIIVSAGPSLVQSIALLKKYRNHALIVAVDTAYKVLLKHGLEPHIVMVLDAQKQSQLHFFGTHSDTTVLLADIVSSPPVIRNFSNPIFISTTAKYYDDDSGVLQRETTPFVDWIEKHVSPFGDIQSGGSVATSVFDFLLNSGCSEIVLVGQDLAYTGRKIHSNGTHHNEKWVSLINRFKNLETINQNVVRKRKIKYVESLVPEKKIMSDFVLDLYRGWFADSAQKIKLPVINTTAIGAHIPGTKRIFLNDFFKNRKQPTKCPADIIAKIIKNSHKFKTERLLNALKKGLIEFKNVNSMFENENGSTADTVLDYIEKNELEPIYRPFMKKTLIYISRHNLSEDKRNKLLLDELKHTTKKVSILFKKCAERLQV
ncbi:MAG: DUF115 domain-containing protein [Spirochaetes bacterium]|jgi:hypothetical protein|nr:DUF115 domain-containing protein [Spirochaetota bacterium]